jgi:hypothetical protein
MLPASELDEVPPHPTHQPAAPLMHYTTSCKHSLVLLRMGEIIANVPEDGRNYRPKDVELIGIINKPLLLHQFGFNICGSEHHAL